MPEVQDGNARSIGFLALNTHRITAAVGIRGVEDGSVIRTQDPEGGKKAQQKYTDARTQQDCAYNVSFEVNVKFLDTAKAWSV